MQLPRKPLRYRIVSSLGGPTARTCYVATLGLVFVLRRRWVQLRFLLVAVWGASLCNSLVKEMFARRRPHRFPRIATAGGYSFPSGHSTGSTAFALTVTALLWQSQWRRLAPLLGAVGIAYAALVGRSRVVLNEHHEGDVLAGWALGASWFVMALRLFQTRHGRRPD